jgi:MFS family permease
MKLTAGLTTRGSVSNKRAMLIVLALADLMVVLDTSVVFVALPSIQRALHFSSTSDLQWVVNAYVLAFGGFLLLGGRIADRFGRRLVFVSGVVGFVAASLACGLASSLGILIAARAVKGLAAAFMAPAAPSLVTVIFVEGDERDRALGVWGAIASSGAAIGLVAGGGLVSWLSDRTRQRQDVHAPETHRDVASSILARLEVAPVSVALQRCASRVTRATATGTRWSTRAVPGWVALVSSSI